MALLRPFEGRLIIDGTVGYGGHAEALLEAGATVVGVDRDETALAASRERLARFGPRFSAVEGDFGDLESLVPGYLPADGVLLDLGVSSPQLDEAARGFSFQKEGPLDMRMGRTGQTAAELIESLSEQELADVIYRYGEERFSRPIAKELKRVLPKTTLEAAEAVKRAVPRRAWPSRIHVATRTFQALRIAVNDELESLRRFLEALPRLLKPGGVAAVISFHSLEDRMVKHAFRELCRSRPFALLTRKPVEPTEDERRRNIRARSAKLRAVEKVS